MFFTFTGNYSSAYLVAVNCSQWLERLTPPPFLCKEFSSYSSFYFHKQKRYHEVYSIQ